MMKDLTEDAKEMLTEEGRQRIQKKQRYVFALQRRNELLKQLDEQNIIINEYEAEIKK
jgi:hypothetical protein